MSDRRPFLRSPVAVPAEWWPTDRPNVWAINAYRTGGLWDMILFVVVLRDGTRMRGDVGPVERQLLAAFDGGMSRVVRDIADGKRAVRR